jgi:hypothetical protein
MVYSGNKKQNMKDIASNFITPCVDAHWKVRGKILHFPLSNVQ